jgi:homogentisate phytyltransferase / homogentisate geranylgeranyltransferase
MKDVPDVSGDESARVKTFPVRLGQKLIFDTSKNLLTSLFFVVAASFIKSAFSDVKIMIKLMRTFVGTSAFVAGISVNKEATKVNPQDSSGVYEYYMHLWKLFYICYVLLPLAR